MHSKVALSNSSTCMITEIQDAGELPWIAESFKFTFSMTSNRMTIMEEMKKAWASVLWIAAVLAMESTALVGHAAAQDSTLAPTENLVVEGISPIDAGLVEEVRPYTESRGAAFVDWHPTRREILISTRFANSNQIHWVKFPGGDRSQITFFNEPVLNATFEPKEGKYFVFGRDTGGNEFGQLYRWDVATGKVQLLSDGGRSQNGGLKWNKKKDMVAYSSTRRNGSDRDIWLMDPSNPQEKNTLVMENQGGGWGVTDWSPDDRYLLVIEMLSINKSNLYRVDAKTGERQLLNDEGETVAYRNAQFDSEGKGVYLTSDKFGEFQQIGYMDLATKTITPIDLGIAWDVEALELSPQGDSAILVVNEAGASKVFSLDLKTKKSSELKG